MKRWAMVQNGVVGNVWDGPDDEPARHPNIAPMLVECGPNVQPGYTYSGGVFAPPVPPARRIIPALEFRDRFTDAEQDALYQAAAANTANGRRLRRWLDDAAAAPTVNLDSERVVTGMASLVQAGLLTAARRDQILA